MLSYAVAVTHNSPRPAPSAATIKSRPLTRLFAPTNPDFLIANPRLELRPTHTKQSPLTFSNREYIAVFQFFSRSPALPFSQSSRRMDLGAPIDDKFGRAFRTAGIPAGSFAFSRLITHHLSLITFFLIGTPRLEFAATPTKQTPGIISNRDRMRLLHPGFSRGTSIFPSPGRPAFSNSPASANPPISSAQHKNTPPVSHLTHLRPRTSIVRSSLHRNFYRDLR
jgi:hypothetical protein